MRPSGRITLVGLHKLVCFFLLSLGVFVGIAAAQPLSSTASGPTFDVNAAVNSYLTKVPPDQRARSNAYFEGGYWLLLLNFLYGAAVTFSMLQLRISAKLRDIAEHITTVRVLQTLLYWCQFIVFFTIATFPLSVYQDYFREHRYGFQNQLFSAWAMQRALAFGVRFVLGAIIVTVLFEMVRKLGRNWWRAGAVVTIAFMTLVTFAGPVFIYPLFNKYTAVQDVQIRNSILSMARANGVPANDLYQYDASRQTKRVSAYVAGLAGTTRIALSDNLLRRCSRPEIEAIMGHEIGHYVLAHGYAGFVALALLVVIGFILLNSAGTRILKKWGNTWEVRSISDPAVLPLAILLILFYVIITVPIRNTISREIEYQADMFGLNAAQQPDGAAEAYLKLAEYRKLDPGSLEEFVFFDHPSGRTRITAAMRWKAEHVKGAALQPCPQAHNPEH